MRASVREANVSFNMQIKSESALSASRDRAAL